ncbi:MAG: hypothetical protein JRJ19_06805 [Deltaproteobacteria bacterium]|nr:hypothetical protein [Deltaproteobacteria bacterium]MBW1871755.1 hypothetical protein [Deltaproteobacteria bacterium]
MELNQASFEEALKTLGTLLESRGLSYELVAVGGGSLMLQLAALGVDGHDRI